jgi:superfamily II RNA helicase
MAGRAGRRGKDDKGFSIICADPDMGSIPSNQEILELLDSKGVELASKLKIDYRTCLNVLKQEEGEIGSMLQSSFFANEDMSIKLQNIKQRKHIEPLFEKTKQINCIHGVPD